MFLRKLTLLNFKNHAQREIAFSTKINCFIGKNGVGKTNVVDAIYYLCLTKSYFNPVDQQNILFRTGFFRLQGLFQEKEERYDVVYKLAAGKKKELSINDTPVSKLSTHIGNFPAVIIAPDDSQLVLGNSDERRRFLDNTISQVDRQYLLQLMEYNKVLAQRNSALKQFAETGSWNEDLLAAYNRQLIPLGTAIYQARKTVIAKLQSAFNHYYKIISLEREHTGMAYISQLHERPFDLLLAENEKRDRLLQRTEVGIHKDDIDFFIGENKLKKFGSQGQQKSFIIAIKLAQYTFIKEAKGFLPLLLIDDIFDKLDSDRSQRLTELIAGNEFGQVFLTDTSDAHIRSALDKKEALYNVFTL